MTLKQQISEDMKTAMRAKRQRAPWRGATLAGRDQAKRSR
jgi:uncharacterized protein YqeY